MIVDWTAPQNASITETKAEMDRFEKSLASDPDVTYWSSYVGEGAKRFVLSYDVQPPSPNFGQIVIMSKGLEERDRLIGRLRKIGTDSSSAPTSSCTRSTSARPVGPPDPVPISRPRLQAVRTYAQGMAALVGANPNTSRVTFDWNEPARVVKVDVIQDKARQLGITSQDVATVLNGVVGGTTATQIRDSIYLVDVVSRARGTERSSIETLENLQIPAQNGRSFRSRRSRPSITSSNSPIVWRRDRVPTITIKASLVSAIQPATVVAELKPSVDAFIAKLPSAYRVETGGAVEESGKGQGPIVAVAPLMLIAMMTLLMFQLQSFQRLFIVVAVAPLGLIGVVAALLPSGAPLGFVAILGVLALIGILIRNSVILVVQIEDHIREGFDRWDAVIDATEHRMRPILLTAAAASPGR